MKNKINMLLLFVIVLILCLAGCGMSNSQFLSKIKESKISLPSFEFTSDIKTVSDFEKKIEGYDDDNIGVVTSWNDEKLKQNDSLIEACGKKNTFTYDNKKTYGYLVVSITDYSAKSKIKPEMNYWYLFSLDKDGNVKAEAAATASDDLYNFNDIVLDESAVKDQMAANILYLEVLKGLH